MGAAATLMFEVCKIWSFFTDLSVTMLETGEASEILGPSHL